MFIEFLSYAKPQFSPKAIEQRTHFINKTFAFGSGEDTENADERYAGRCRCGTPIDLVDKQRCPQLDCERERFRLASIECSCILSHALLIVRSANFDERHDGQVDGLEWGAGLSQFAGYCRWNNDGSEEVLQQGGLLEEVESGNRREVSLTTMLIVYPGIPGSDTHLQFVLQILFVDAVDRDPARDQR